MAISYSDLMGYWIKAGGSTATAPLAAAIAMAESGGNPNAHNTKPPDDSYGLWQINMYGSLGPSRRAAYGLSSNSQLLDPATNARAAVAIGKGGFGPWSTYTSGAYKKYLNGNTTPNLGVTGGAGSTPTATTASLTTDVASGFLPMFNTFGNLIVYGAAFAGGAILLAAGIYMLFRGTDPTGLGAAGAAVRVVGGPAGRAVVGGHRKVNSGKIAERQGRS